MSKYDRQLILQLQPDGTITSGSDLLDQKAASSGLTSCIFSVPEGPQAIAQNTKNLLANEINKLTAWSRLYIRGHGDYINQQLGDWGPVEAADLLVDAGLKTIKLISITGCCMAWDSGTAQHTVRVKNSADSFASKFHRRLHKYGIDVELVARTKAVRIAGQELIKGYKSTHLVRHRYNGAAKTAGKFTDGTYIDEEKNITVNKSNVRYKDPFSKVKFYYSGNVQKRAWAYNNNEIATDPEDD
jgi:hypothetical protein